MISEKQERPSTKCRLMTVLRRQAEGGAQVFILCLSILFFLVVLYRVLFDYQKMDITHDNVDDALVTSLISSCVFNRDEYGSSGALVMYRQVTPFAGTRISYSPGGIPYIDNTPVDVINLPDLTAPSGDIHLERCWTLFLKNLKNNLKLDSSMTAQISGIEGEVVIDEFSVYNKFVNLDADRNQTDFRFVKYTYTPSSGTWMATSYTENTYPATYNSLDHAMYTITETSVSAKLEFDLVSGSMLTGSTGITSGQSVTHVSYQRVVDIKSN